MADIEDACIMGLDFLTLSGACVNVAGAYLQIVQEVIPLKKGQRVIFLSLVPARGQATGQNSPESTLKANPWNVSTTLTQFTVPVPSPSKETVQTVQQLWQRSREGLTPTQHQQLWEVLAHNQDIFAAHDEDCGRTRLVQHDIDTAQLLPSVCVHTG